VWVQAIGGLFLLRRAEELRCWKAARRGLPGWPAPEDGAGSGGTDREETFAGRAGREARGTSSRAIKRAHSADRGRWRCCTPPLLGRNGSCGPSAVDARRGRADVECAEAGRPSQGATSMQNGHSALPIGRPVA
ncbi:unnamed protein product, partial [Symbiodinium necroappetens]